MTPGKSPDSISSAVSEHLDQMSALPIHDEAKEISVVHQSEIKEGSDINHSGDAIHGNVVKDTSLDTNFQTGVQKAEAITITWSKSTLILAYIAMWLIYFAQGLVSGITGSLLPYVTSDFAEHSLIPTTGVLSQVIGGVTNLGVAKVLDIFGRPHGFILCVTFCVLGLVTSAVCNNVETYAASQVFYTVGVNGIGYSLSVFIADTSSLRYRGLMQALASSPYMITSWIVGPIATSLLAGPGWRWGFGIGTILIPVVTLPLYGLFMLQYRKAKKAGIIAKRNKSGRTFWDSVIYYGQEFDIIGLLLISTGFAFFLLPFSLYTQQVNGWASALVICFLVFGILLIIVFVLWERFFARIQLTPWSILRDRTVLGSCMVAFILFLSTSCWNAYFSSFLQVVNGLSITQASYLIQGGVVIQIVMNIVSGLIISITGHYKPITLFFGFPMVVLGSGLMIYFRQPDLNVHYVAMSYVFINLGFGILMLTVEIGILAAVAEQQYFAISIALLNLFAYIGSAIGFTISSAIWQAVIPDRLAAYLPVEALGDLSLIYGDITQQLSYEWGSSTRLAIQQAYGDTWRLLLITSTVFWSMGFLAILAWKDNNVKGIKQNKGFVV